MRPSVRSLLDLLAGAVLERDARAMCALLTGPARATMGCGTDEEDLPPVLWRGIQTADDLQVLYVHGDQAVATFPNRRPTAQGLRLHGAHRLLLVRVEGSWRVSEFLFRD